MASDESINKMIRAIIDKRRQLGLVDWGMVPVEEVVSRLNRQPKSSPSEHAENLAQDEFEKQNKEAPDSSDPSTP